MKKKSCFYKEKKYIFFNQNDLTPKSETYFKFTVSIMVFISLPKSKIA